MRLYKLSINNKPYDVKIQDISSTEIKAKVNNSEYIVAINDILKIGGVKRNTDSSIAKFSSKRKKATPLAPTTGTAITGDTIKSPIPGQIKNILVKPGDRVSKGQKIMILEAMKLENEINSNCEGSIKKIHIKEGDTVNQGQILIEFE